MVAKRGWPASYFLLPTSYTTLCERGGQGCTGRLTVAKPDLVGLIVKRPDPID